MASRLFTYPLALKKGMVLLAGTITTDASGNITAQNFLGGTATKTGTGAYRITLQDRYVAQIAVVVDMQQTTVSAYSAESAITTDPTATTPVIDFITKNAGAAANVTSISKIAVMAVLSNSSV